MNKHNRLYQSLEEDLEFNIVDAETNTLFANDNLSSIATQVSPLKHVSNK